MCFFRWSFREDLRRKKIARCTFARKQPYCSPLWFYLPTHHHHRDRDSACSKLSLFSHPSSILLIHPSFYPSIQFNIQLLSSYYWRTELGPDDFPSSSSPPLPYRLSGKLRLFRFQSAFHIPNSIQINFHLLLPPLLYRFTPVSPAISIVVPLLTFPDPFFPPSNLISI
jgi:hypothetical protein